MTEITQGFDLYGKSISKSGKNLVSQLTKLTTKNCMNLAESMKSFGNYNDQLGAVYSKSSISLNSIIAQRIGKISDDASSCRKKMIEEAQQAMRDLSSAKTVYSKFKAKYDKALKERESSISALKKAKNDSGSNFQVGVSQKYKDKANVSKKELVEVQENLGEHIEMTDKRHKILENILAFSHNQIVSLEKESMHVMRGLVESVLVMIKNIIVLKQEQAELKNDQLAELGNITLDLIMQPKDSEAKNGNPIELLCMKLESRLISCDDRIKVLKAFRTYLTEVCSFDEILGKTFEKQSRGLLLSEIIANKSESKSM